MQYRPALSTFVSLKYIFCVNDNVKIYVKMTNKFFVHVQKYIL